MLTFVFELMSGEPVLPEAPDPDRDPDTLQWFETVQGIADFVSGDGDVNECVDRYVIADGGTLRLPFSTI